jgi:hypothetical protein
VRGRLEPGADSSLRSQSQLSVPRGHQLDSCLLQHHQVGPTYSEKLLRLRNVTPCFLVHSYHSKKITQGVTSQKFVFFTLSVVEISDLMDGGCLRRGGCEKGKRYGVKGRDRSTQ